MKNLSIYILFLGFILTSCGNDFYLTNQANLLILQERAELKAALSFNSSQVAYSPIKHLGLKSDFAYMDFSEYNTRGRLFLGTLGVGTYFSKPVKPLFPNKRKLFSNPQLCSIGIEFYASASLGNYKFNIDNTRSVFFPGSSPGSGLGIFESKIFKPHLSSQVYWQSRSFTVNFGLRTGLIYYYEGFAFGDFSEFRLDQARDLIENTPFYLVEYDLQIAKGNNRIQSFIGVSWGSSFGPLINGNGSVTFGLKMNIPTMIDSIKNNKFKRRSRK